MLKIYFMLAPPSGRAYHSSHYEGKEQSQSFSLRRLSKVPERSLYREQKDPHPLFFSPVFKKGRISVPQLLQAHHGRGPKPDGRESDSVHEGTGTQQTRTGFLPESRLLQSGEEPRTKGLLLSKTPSIPKIQPVKTDRKEPVRILFRLVPSGHS